MIYIAVLCNPKITAEPLYITPLFIEPYAAANYGAFSMKALARYQIILLGEQRHIRCEQLAQGCCPNNAAVGVEPATSWSRVQRPTATPPSHRVGLVLCMLNPVYNMIEQQNDSTKSKVCDCRKEEAKLSQGDAMLHDSHRVQQSP